MRAPKHHVGSGLGARPATERAAGRATAFIVPRSGPDGALRRHVLQRRTLARARRPIRAEPARLRCYCGSGAPNATLWGEVADDDVEANQLATEASEERTVGQALEDMSLEDALVYGGVLLLIVGSLGTWVTAGIVSASGFSGDGKWMALLAFLVAFGFYRGRRQAALFCFALLLAWGIYEFVHISNQASKLTVFGQHAFMSDGACTLSSGPLSAYWQRGALVADLFQLCS